MAKTYRGIDISRYQGNPDFSKVKTAVDFCIIQAGYGKYAKQVDSSFERNYAECKKHGIPVGVYWFSYATTVEDAKKEAEACLSVIKGKQFEYPVYFDVEGDALTTKATVSACCKAFCNALEKAGYYAGIYISRSPAQTHLDNTCITKYALWLAEYGPSLNWNGDVGIWQYSSSGSVPGISGNVDVDTSYIDYKSIIVNGGYNGFPKKKDTPKKESSKILDKTGFKKGARNAGILAYKELLLQAKDKGLIKASISEDTGFGDGTTKATNELLKRFGYKQTGVMGPNLVKLLAKELRK